MHERAMSRLSRRTFLKQTAVVSGALLGAAVLPSLAALGQAQDSKLTFWWWGEQEAPGLEKWVAETSDLYRQNHPGVEIDAVLQATESLLPGFKAAAEAKQGPDLQYMWGGVYTLEYVWQGHVTAISDLLPKEELDHVFPSNLNETAYQGKVWGLPWYVFPLTLAYNRSMFAKAGLDAENPPRSWDDFLAAADQLKAAGFTPWGYGLKGLSGIGNFSNMFILQELDTPIDILKPAVGEASFTDPRYSGWFTRLKELIDRGVFNKDVNSLEYFQAQDLFPAGQAAIVVAGQSQIAGYVKALGEEAVGVMLPPVFGKGKLAGKLVTTSQQLFVTSWSSQREQAADFLRFMRTPERLKAMYAASGAIPPDDRFDSAALNLPQERQLLEWARTSSATNYQNYWPPQMDRENLFLAVQAIFAGDKTPEQAAQQVQEFLDRWREKNQDQVTRLADWAKAAA